MAIHRDSPGFEPETTDFDRPEPRKRFARLVESSAARRLSLSRLGLVVGVAGSVLVVLLYGTIWLVGKTTAFVHSQPDQQIAFSKIELVPEPGLWVKGGAELILEQVRQASKRGETLNRLDLNLKELTNDFKLSPWVKRVVSVERPPGRLRVHLEVRKPVAAVFVEGTVPVVEVIDDEGVPLNREEILWISLKPPYYKVEGIAEPLIVIWGADRRSKPRYGIPWQALDEDARPVGPDLMIEKAARLADFLRKQPKTTPSGKPAPTIGEIRIPDDLAHPFVIKDIDQNSIVWGKSPGDEKPGDLSSEERWKRLLDWIDAHGPIRAKAPDYLYCTSKGWELLAGKPRTKKENPPH